jgi:GntR family transcriptional repressor for pyruvate dehydrogenase complex
MWDPTMPTGEDEQTAGEGALQALTEMIRSQQVRPGDRLPPERQLAESLGFSRNTLREGIRALEMMRILEVRPGRGIYVSSLEPGVLLQATAFVTQLFRDHTVVEMLEVRSILDHAAAAQAAARISTDELQAIKEILVESGQATASRHWLDLDIRFHAQIAACAGNEFMASLLNTTAAGTYDVRLLQADVLGTSAWEIGLAQHQRIYEALLRRDPHGAALEAASHANGTTHWLRAVLAAKGQ